MHAETALPGQLVTGAQGARPLAPAQLARQATGGDRDAFEELVRRLQRRVYGFAYQHLRDLAESEDLTQEIFVKLYRNLGRYDSARPFEPWFWKLAANTTINFRRKRVPLPLPAPSPSDESAASPRAVELQQHDPVLADALAQLDPAYRLPVLLHYYADLSVEQIAQALHLSTPAVKSRLHRARASLRNALAEADTAQDGSN